MIFKYDELKECVSKDFSRFYTMGFNGKQIYPAILDEYKYGEDFCQVENICIHSFIIIKYIENNFNANHIYKELEDLLKKIDKEVLKQELTEEYETFLRDMDIIMSLKKET